MTGVRPVSLRGAPRQVWFFEWPLALEILNSEFSIYLGLGALGGDKW